MLRDLWLEAWTRHALKQFRRSLSWCVCIWLMGSGGALAEDANRATQITVNYDISLAGFHFGDVRLIIILRNADYQMKGDGQFAVLGGLLYQWTGGTTSSGQLSKSGPRPSLYMLRYSGGDKQGDVRISFADGEVSGVSASPKKRASPKNIPVTVGPASGRSGSNDLSIHPIASQHPGSRP
jgi:Protein of unknown function (DUF3108)